MDGLFKECSYEEILVEVAWMSQWLKDEGKLRNDLDCDSWDEKLAVFEIAKKFYEDYKERQWEYKDEFYYEIQTYAEKELKEE